MRFCLLAAGIVVVGATIGASRADAMPMFARKYEVGCAYCHTTIPRLNQTGFKFRAAGFRLLETVGKPEPAKKFELGDNFSARIQTRFDTQATNHRPYYDGRLARMSGVDQAAEFLVFLDEVSASSSNNVG
jgi:hypothetical protein